MVKAKFQNFKVFKICRWISKFLNYQETHTYTKNICKKTISEFAKKQTRNLAKSSNKSTFHVFQNFTPPLGARYLSQRTEGVSMVRRMGRMRKVGGMEDGQCEGFGGKKVWGYPSTFFSIPDPQPYLSPHKP